jgi:hypothetical protein
MSQIPVQKTVFNKDTYERVINTQFKQFLNSNVEEEQPSFTIEDFFQLYENLFFLIPKEGEINSHQYILSREAEYLGVDINQDNVQALIDEITSLRQQVLDTQTVVNELTKATSNI